MNPLFKMAVLTPKESNQETHLSLVDIICKINETIINHLDNADNLLDRLPFTELLSLVISNTIVNLLRLHVVDILIPEDRLRIMRLFLNDVENLSFELWSSFEANDVDNDVCN